MNKSQTIEKCQGVQYPVVYLTFSDRSTVSNDEQNTEQETTEISVEQWQIEINKKRISILPFISFSCGQIFCESCAGTKLPLASSNKPVRVCDVCRNRLLAQCAVNNSWRNAKNFFSLFFCSAQNENKLFRYERSTIKRVSFDFRWMLTNVTNRRKKKSRATAFDTFFFFFFFVVRRQSSRFWFIFHRWISDRFD